MSEDDIATMTYEQALAELDSLIARLEGGAVQLDEAIACYERGSRLAQRCGELLDRTETSVTQLVVGAGGAVQERPLEAEVAEPGAPPAPGRPAGRPLVPPPPGSPARARVAGAPGPAPGLFPGLEPPERSGGVEIDPDDIPF